jgi:RHS repeat-associated protein
LSEALDRAKAKMDADLARALENVADPLSKAEFFGYFESDLTQTRDFCLSSSSLVNNKNLIHCVEFKQYVRTTATEHPWVFAGYWQDSVNGYPICKLGDLIWVDNSAQFGAVKLCLVSDKPLIPICPRPTDSGVLTTGPILPATGEKIKLQTDFTDNAPHGLDFSRTYRTAWGDVAPASGMGTNWNHRFGMQLAALSDNLSKTVQMPDGSQRRFTRSSATAAWVNTDGTDQLSELSLNGVLGGYMFTNAQTDDIWQFNTSGKPTTLTQRNGWAYQLAYNPSGQLATVTNKFGCQLAFTYNASGLLSGVAAPDGQQISYQYNSDSSLTYAGYGTNSVPNTSSIQYLYENPSFPKALTGMIDESGARSATYSYDAQGRAISSELAGGVDRYQVSYSDSTSVGALNTSATITDPLGTQRNYSYAMQGGQLAVTGAGQVSNGMMPGKDAASRVQNTSGLIDSETDYLGVQTMYTWDVTRKLPLSTTKAAGRPEAQTTNTTWHPTMRLPISVAESGRTTSYTYDATGNRLTQSVVDTVTGQVKTTAWTYNTSGLTTTETAPNSAKTSYSYDAAGNIATAKNALNQTTSYQYDGAGRVTVETAPNGLVTLYSYDGKGRLLAMNRGGLVSSYTYTPSGQLATSTQPNGMQTSYTYDAAQRLTGWADNRGASGSYTLDAIGNRTTESIKNAAGQVAWQTVRSINEVNRVVAETVGASGDALSSGISYNANGDLVQEANGLGESTTYGLDGLKRLAAITNAQGASAQISYNALDSVVAASDFKGAVTSYDRDAQGNAKRTHSNDAGLHSAQYDALGLPTSVTDALGQATSITRDLLGRPTLITYADDANSATARTTTITYDVAGYAKVITDPAAKTTYIRDTLGRVTRKTQLLSSGANSVVNYTYVAANTAGAGQLASMSYPNGGILSNVYSNTGQLSGLNWAISATAAAQALISNITWSPLGQPLSWNWDFADAAGTTVPLGTATVATTQTANRSFDTAGRMTANEFASYQYDPAGRIVQITQKIIKPTLAANGTVTTGAAAAAAPFTQVPVTYNVTYDPVGRITAFTQTGTATISTPVSSISFTFDANGNRQTSVQSTTTLVKTGGTTAAPILTPSTQTTTKNYTIDPTGNKLLGFSQTMTQTGGAANGATSTASVNYSYDANGALLTDGLRHYAYDSEGRLAAASLGWSSTATTDDSITKYAHNSQAQRVFKTAPLYAVTNPEESDPQDIWTAFTSFFESLWNPTTAATQKAGMSYVYDDSEGMGGTLIAQTLTGGAQSSWGQSARYVYLPTASGPMPVAAIYGTKHYAIQSDHLNTPRRLIQSDGQVAWQWAYSAFGEEKPTTAKTRFANADLNQSFGTTNVPEVTFNLRYPGQYFDQESNLHYNYHRSYSATVGRYTQADPIGLDGGWNRFGYAAENPLKFTDPLGLSIWDLITGGGKKKAKDLNCPDTCPTFQTCYACCVAKNMATHDAGTTCQVSCNDTPYPDNPYDPKPANPKPEKK